MSISSVLFCEEGPVVAATLIAGFLGSGKTTLLNGMLRAPDMGESAVIINEFGDVPIDQHFIDLPDDGVAVLPNGCLCCVASDGVEDALIRLTSSAKRNGRPLNRIFIETSGLADPTPAMQLVLDLPTPVGRIVLDKVVVTIDAEHIVGQVNGHPECRRQIAVADEIVFTKSDRLNTAAIGAARSFISSLNPQATQLTGCQGIVSNECPPSGRRTPCENPDAACRQQTIPNGACSHSDDIRAFSFVWDHPVEWTPFSRWLRRVRREHGGSILRMKGILDVVGVEEPIAIDAVHHVGYPPRRMRKWDGGKRSSTLVFIAEGVSEDQIRAGSDEWNRRLVSGDS